MKLNIEFDIDGIILNFLDYFKEWIERNLPVYDFIQTNEFCFKFKPSISHENIRMMVNQSILDSYHNSIKPVWDILSFIRYLYNTSRCPIRFVTSRNMSLASKTFKSMNYIMSLDYFLNYNKESIPFSISFANNLPKHYFIESDFFMEDRRKNCIELVKNGISTIMPVRYYNWPIPRDCGVNVRTINLIKNYHKDPAIYFYYDKDLADHDTLVKMANLFILPFK